ncbi:MAG: SURF1 family protein [Halieaceae bacterium]|jgi:cytochrome oxidase assembly protein ShyY1|nr:SURF1 family protein [Halieaceae bacterium]
MPAADTRLRFDPEWRTTLFTLVLVPLMAWLGLWQLQRAEEKAAMAASWEQRQSQPPVPLEHVWDEPAAGLAYLPVRVSGVFEADRYFLLDNRIYEGRFGYEVLGIMRLDDGDRRVLVNRGWIAGDPARRVMPDIPAVGGRVELLGHIYVPPGVPYTLAEQNLGESWPKVLQSIEMTKILHTLGVSEDGQAFPYSVRIAAGQPGALIVDWQVVNVSPQKHRAYAAQWFTMAAVLLLFYLFRSSNLWQWITRSGSERS